MPINPLNDSDKQSILQSLEAAKEVLDVLERAQRCGLDMSAEIESTNDTIDFAQKMLLEFFGMQVS